MSNTAQERELDGWCSLYTAEDQAGFYEALSRILDSRFGMDRFAIYLWDRHRKAFLEYSHAGFVEQDSPPGCSYPLVVHGQELGRLLLATEIPAGAAELSDLCRHIGTALYQRKLVEDQNRVIEESLAHVQALKAMGELLGDLDEELVLNRILKFFIDLVGAEVGAGLLFEDEDCLVKARWGMPSQMLPLLYSAGREVDQGPHDHLLQGLNLPAELTEEYSFGGILRLSLNLKTPYRAELYLVSGEELLPGPQQRTIIDSCQVIAGIALQNTLDHRDQIRQQRLDEQLVLARDIQRQLLPAQIPAVDCLAIAGRSLPAQYIGGDYFDILPLEGGDLLAFIADVSGKGVQAAMRMGGLRALLHGMVPQDLGPGEVLARLNQFLGENRLHGHFVTACCARIEKGGRHARLASAGHESPVVTNGADDPRFLDCMGGFPLGIFLDQNYEEIDLELQEGERLLLYTDGLTDARNADGEQFGHERLTASFRDSNAKTATELLEQIFTSVEEFKGEMPWIDDLTALVFHCQAKGNG